MLVKSNSFPLLEKNLTMELQNMTIRKNPAIIRQNAAKEENLVLVPVVLVLVILVKLFLLSDPVCFLCEFVRMS